MLTVCLASACCLTLETYRVAIAASCRDLYSISIVPRSDWVSLRVSPLSSVNWLKALVVRAAQLAAALVSSLDTLGQSASRVDRGAGVPSRAR